jgi:hypothetical protein
MHTTGRLTVFASAAVLTAGLAAGVATATASTSAPSAHRSTDHDSIGQTIRLKVHFRPFDQNYVDIGSAGPGVGDLLVFQDQLLRDGKRVGVEGGSCTVTAVLRNGFQTHCVGTASLPAGQIAFQGLVTNAPDKHMAVVGGTGRYRGAGGDVTLVELGHDEAGTLTIRLLGDDPR